jgi:hypothetical protein
LVRPSVTSEQSPMIRGEATARQGREVRRRVRVEIMRRRDG